MIELLARLIGAATITIVLYPVAVNCPTVGTGVTVGAAWLACMLAVMPSSD